MLYAARVLFECSKIALRLEQRCVEAVLEVAHTTDFAGH
jgi:hypothetical protein